MKIIRILWLVAVITAGYGFAYHAFTQKSDPTGWVVAGVLLYAAATIATGAALYGGDEVK